MIFIEEKEWNELVFKPQGELKKPKYKKIEIFKDSWEKMVVQEPFANASLATKKDLEETVERNNNATDEEKRQYINCDEDACYYIKEYMDENDLEYSDDTIEYLENQCVPIIRHYKNKFNRPRPYQIAELYKIPMPKRFKTGTAKTPSYPSGHTVQPFFVAEYYAKLYPEHRKGLMKGAEISGFGRVIAGLHFPSDYVCGKSIAQQLISHLNIDKLEEDAPMNATGSAVQTHVPIVRKRDKRYEPSKIFDLIKRNAKI